MTPLLKHSILIAFVVMSQTLWPQSISVGRDQAITSVKEAVLKATDFDTIMIKPGIYKEHGIIIDKPLTIIGEGHPLIDGELKGEIITIISNHVTIKGLKIINVGTSYTEDFAAIRVKRSKYFEIKDLILEKLFFGIYLEKAADGKVINNTITGEAIEEHNSGNAIHLWYCKNVVVDHNTVSHVRDGIYLEFSDDCLIKNNTSSNNLRYGLHFMFSNNDVYENNTFSFNGAGVAVMFSKQIKMLKNVFKENWGTASYGLLLKEINDADIKRNTFAENTIGINIEGSNRITYEHNTFKNNGWAVKVRGACYSNRFLSNNFMYNSFDISYNSNINDNGFDKNYWSNYTGYDLDKNGIGDVPYRPVKLFSYVVNRTPETIILLRSLFIDIIDFSEKVSPVFTPDNLLDKNPRIKQITW